jgi:transposase
VKAPTLNADPRLLRLESIIPTSEAVTLVVTTIAPDVRCPTCGHLAVRVHSRYQRRVADLPWNGTPVRLKLFTRRFFCDTAGCRCRIFTERLPGVVARYSRRTERLADALRLLGSALGGEAGAKVAAALGLEGSADALLSLLKSRLPEEPPTPRVLGVDDWALKRGHRYGTLLVNLEARRPIALLPERKAETLSTWLKEHPGVEVICRDRAGAYAEGARQGAPEAVQVADRFHLLQNVVTSLEGVLVRSLRVLRQAVLDEPAGSGGDPSAPELQAAGRPTEAVPPAMPWARKAGTPHPPSVRALKRQRRAERRSARAARVRQVHRLAGLGYFVEQIAQQTGITRATVRRYLAEPKPPPPGGPGQPSKVTAPLRQYLRRRWQAGCHNGRQLYRELVERGFEGSKAGVYRVLAPWRALLPPKPEPKQGPAKKASRSPTPDRPPSPRTVTWWLLGEGGELTVEQQAFLERLQRHCPPIAVARRLAVEFFRLLRDRDAGALEAWLRQAEASGVGELQSRAAGFRKDKEAVLAALTSPWSNGPTEGHVNRLKLIKRQGYGRAGLDLLQARVLAAA